MKKLIGLIPLLSSCSVMMAASRTGTDLETLEKATNRQELIASGAKLVSSEEESEIFIVPKNHRSFSRAILYSWLDVATCFLWEVAGTPLELAQEEFYTVKVVFDEEDQVTSLQRVSTK